jgi:creatinine amidohydrolase
MASMTTAAHSFPSRFWADCTAHDFAQFVRRGDADHAVAVLPVAAIEQHGPHLPVSVDTTLVNEVIAACLPHLRADAQVLFLPTQPIGKSNEHARFPGTLTLSAQTLIAVWMELGACVAAAGFKKLLLFNSHGGQISVMDIVARDLRAQHDLLVYSSNWFTLPLGSAGEAFSAEEHPFCVHAARAKLQQHER